MNDEFPAGAQGVALPHVLAYITSVPWALDKLTLATMQFVMTRRLAGVRLSPAEIRAAIGEKAQGGRIGRVRAGGVAVLPVRGIIAHRADQIDDVSGPGGTSIEAFQSQFRQADRKADVKSILLDFDTPGGSTAMLTEMAAEIRNRSKPVTAFVNPMANSAGYWLASQADRVVTTPSGHMGSIGVFAAHEDMSEQLARDGIRMTLISAGDFKTDGNPFEPLTETARAEIQDRVDAAYANFVADVARGRGVTPDAVRAGFGRGRVVTAERAIADGLADQIATFDETLADMMADAGEFQQGGTVALERGPLVVVERTERQREQIRAVIQQIAAERQQAKPPRKLKRLPETRFI